MLKPTSRVPAVLAAVTSAAVIAACGSGSPSVTNSTTTATTPTPGGALAYARCMRSHGVTGFPDPTNSGANGKQAIVSALQAVGNSRAQAAQTACMNVNDGSPGTGQNPGPNAARTRALLAFARCMRSRGLTKFPDPTATGELTQQMLTSVGISLHQPAAVRLADACAGVTHGVITKATVARFIAGS